MNIKKVKEELFSEEKEMIGKLKKAFLMVAGGAVQKYGPDLDGHQQLLTASADILIEIPKEIKSSQIPICNRYFFGKDFLFCHWFYHSRW